MVLFLVKKFLRSKIYRSYGYICSEYEVSFINRKLDKELRYNNSNPGSSVSQLLPHHTEIIFSVPKLHVSRTNHFLRLL